MNDRKTGKTFRAILKALQLASEGKDVIFIDNFMYSACYKHGIALDISNGYLSYWDNYNLVFPNGGRVEFTSREFSNPKEPIIVEDYV